MSSRVGRAIVLVLAAGLLVVGLGGARTTAWAPDLKLRYLLHLAGVPVAELTLGHEVEGRSYRAGLEIDTVGLVARLTGYQSEQGVTGRVRRDRGLTPSAYHLASAAREKTRTIDLRFDASSGDVVDLRITKRGRPDDSDVPAELQKGVMDPLSAFLRLRDHAAVLRDGDGDMPPFEAAVFDGRKRTDVGARLLGRDSVLVGGRTWPVLRLELTLRPLAGYDDDSLEQAGALEAYRMELLLSDDDRLLPLRLTTLDWFISASIELVEDCSTSSGCRLAALAR